ncbi:MAG: FMN-binding protein [Gammaproteobacteria bacterium]|jgi:NosR/NirI family nitrous oxide reductase transcriptional regulator|nr:FMN-binding protein [Gammaproteobacteria bacterium]
MTVRALVRGVFLYWLWLTAAGAAPPAAERGIAQAHPEVVQLFPGADRFGAVAGDPPAAPVFRGGNLLGYAFVSDAVVRIPGYSGRPINLLIGLGLDGTITGARVLEHQETILRSHFPKGALERFVAGYAGRSIRERYEVGIGRRTGYVNVDALTGATVTSMAVNRSILAAARRVALSRGLLETGEDLRPPPATVREDGFQTADWAFLTGNGAIRHLLLTRGDVEQALAARMATGPMEPLPEDSDCRPLPEGDSCDVFIDLYYAYLNAPTIGRNLLGEPAYARLMAELEPGSHAIAVLARGLYSFKGTAYVHGGVFDRVQLRQDGQAITFRDADHRRLDDPALAGMPDFTERSIFIVHPEAGPDAGPDAGFGFDPGAPWALELRVRHMVAARTGVAVSFAGEYQIPAAYVVRDSQR